LVYEKRKGLGRKITWLSAKNFGEISFGRCLILLVVAVVPQFQLFANTSSNNKHPIS